MFFMIKPFLTGKSIKTYLTFVSSVVSLESTPLPSFSEIIFSGKYLFPLHFKCGTEKSQFVITLHTVSVRTGTPYSLTGIRGRAKGVNWD